MRLGMATRGGSNISLERMEKGEERVGRRRERLV